MKYLFTAAIIFVFSLNVFSQKGKEAESIPWTSDKLLVWEDFQKKAPKKHFASAMSNISFEVNMQVSGEDMTVFIQSAFIPSGSWVKKDDKSDHLLKHEQTHFDIYEVHARKLRKELLTKKLTSVNVESTVTRLIEKYQKQSVTETQKYDEETEHSIKKEKQYKWNDEVDEELNSLKDYNDPNVVVKIEMK